MLADAFTKAMPPDLLMKYMKDGIYAFKYDTELKNTKRGEPVLQAPLLFISKFQTFTSGDEEFNVIPHLWPIGSSP